MKKSRRRKSLEPHEVLPALHAHAQKEKDFLDNLPEEHMEGLGEYRESIDDKMRYLEKLFEEQHGDEHDFDEVREKFLTDGEQDNMEGESGLVSGGAVPEEKRRKGLNPVLVDRVQRGIASLKRELGLSNR
jgi:hypothetical protein